MHITRLICRGILGLPLWMIRAQNKRVTKWSVIAIITIIHNSCVHGHARSSVGLYWVAYYIPAGASDPENEIKWNLLVIAKDRTFFNTACSSRHCTVSSAHAPRYRSLFTNRNGSRDEHLADADNFYLKTKKHA